MARVAFILFHVLLISGFTSHRSPTSCCKRLPVSATSPFLSASSSHGVRGREGGWSAPHPPHVSTIINSATVAPLWFCNTQAAAELCLLSGRGRRLSTRPGSRTPQFHLRPHPACSWRFWKVFILKTAQELPVRFAVASRTRPRSCRRSGNRPSGGCNRLQLRRNT